MKKWILILSLTITAAPELMAQHCPFDGSSAVLIHIMDSTGKGMDHTPYHFILAETDTVKADSCTYANGPLLIPFGSIDSALVKKYPNSWEYRAGIYVQKTTFNQPGYFIVVLNQAQASCMIDRNNNFHYIKRKFEIRVQQKGIVINRIPVTEEKIYSLCTSSGPWTRFQSIDIVLPD
jgi:hypothetical protein